MALSFNSIIMGVLTLYLIWMAWSEDRKEKASVTTLTSDQRKRFDAAYSFAQPAADYDTDLQPHAAVAQRARIRKAIAVILLIAVAFLILFRSI